MGSSHLPEIKAPPEVVSPLRRRMCIPVAMLSALAGLGPFIDADSYTSPLFDTFRALAPLTYWGVIWLVITVGAVVSSVTGDVRWYIPTHAGLIASAGFWAMVLLYARVVEGLDVSLPAFGLWLFPTVFGVVSLSVPIAYVRTGQALHSDS